MNRNASRWSVAIGPLALCLLLCLPSTSLGKEPPLTPAEVVLQWLEWYPKNLSMAATLTTTILRNGLSEKEWIEKNDQLLQDLQFKYLEAKVLEAKGEGVNASVTVKVRLFVVIGEVRQVERYRLKNVEGHWLIDGQEIQEDRIIGRTVSVVMASFTPRRYPRRVKASPTQSDPIRLAWVGEQLSSLYGSPFETTTAQGHNRDSPKKE